MTLPIDIATELGLAPNPRTAFRGYYFEDLDEDDIEFTQYTYESAGLHDCE